MALNGQAALAMWWDMAPAMRQEFEHWHTHEHFPERLGIPGFRRATRWRDAGGAGGFFVLYELEAWEVLASPGYARSLNAPTPWSTRMMPHHRNMVRSQCRVLASHGAAAGAFALTLRLSPDGGGAGDDLLAGLAPLVASLPGRSGLAGAHLLQHQAPALAPTTEQKIRGHDGVADRVLVVVGYERDTLEALARTELGETALVGMGAAAGAWHGLYQLSASATATDIA